MDILTRINTPTFIDNVLKVVESSALLKNIEGVEDVGRLPQRDLLLVYKHIVHKVGQDIIYKREINDQRLVHDMVLALVCAKNLSPNKKHNDLYTRITKDVEAVVEIDNLKK